MERFCIIELYKQIFGKIKINTDFAKMSILLIDSKIRGVKLRQNKERVIIISSYPLFGKLWWGKTATKLISQYKHILNGHLTLDYPSRSLLPIFLRTSLVIIINDIFKFLLQRYQIATGATICI